MYESVSLEFRVLSPLMNTKRENEEDPAFSDNVCFLDR